MQSPAQAARGALQLLDSLLLRHGLPHTALAAAMAASVGGGGGVMAAAGVVSMPAGCLEELVARHEADEGLAEAAVAMGGWTGSRGRARAGGRRGFTVAGSRGRLGLAVTV